MQRGASNSTVPWIGLLTACAWLVFVGCSNKKKRIETQPNQRASRGESCQVRNDCNKGLHCIQQRCVKAEYDISTTAKECNLVECAGDADCCAGMGVVGEGVGEVFLLPGHIDLAVGDEVGSSAEGIVHGGPGITVADVFDQS